MRRPEPGKNAIRVEKKLVRAAKRINKAKKTKSRKGSGAVPLAQSNRQSMSKATLSSKGSKKRSVDIEKDVVMRGDDYLTQVAAPLAAVSITAGTIIHQLAVFPSSPDLKGTRFEKLGLLWQMYGPAGSPTFRFDYQPTISPLASGNIGGFIVWNSLEADNFISLTPDERLRAASATSGFKATNVWNKLSIRADWPKGYTTLYTNGGASETELQGFCTLMVIAMTDIGPAPAAPVLGTLGYLEFVWDVALFKTIVDDSRGRPDNVVQGNLPIAAPPVGPIFVGIDPSSMFDMMGTVLTPSDTAVRKGAKAPKDGLGLFELLADLIPGGALIADVVDVAGRLFKGIQNDTTKPMAVTTSTKMSKVTRQDLNPTNYLTNALDGMPWLTNMCQTVYDTPSEFTSEMGTIYGSTGVEVSTSDPFPIASKTALNNDAANVAGVIPSSTLTGSQYQLVPTPVVQSSGGYLLLSTIQHSSDTPVLVAYLPPGAVFMPSPFTRPPVVDPTSVFEKTVVTPDGAFDGTLIDQVGESGLTTVQYRIGETPPTAATRGKLLHANRRLEIVPRDVAKNWYSYPLNKHPYVSRMTIHTAFNYLVQQEMGPTYSGSRTMMYQVLKATPLLVRLSERTSSFAAKALEHPALHARAELLEEAHPSILSVLNVTDKFRSILAKRKAKMTT